MNAYLPIGGLIVAACSSMSLAGSVVQLDPGDIVDSLSGITNTQMPELIGTLEFDAYQDFSIAGAQGFGGIDPLYSATLLTRMVRSNQTGMLTMNFQILDSSADLIGAISHVEITGFEGLVTRVEYRNELTGPNLVGPDSAARSEDGSMISFGFGNGLGSSDSSKFFFAMLDVADYDFDGLSPSATIFLTTGESVSLDINPPVPAPGALALLGMGGLAISRRRR